jgi:hypothetical protein
VGIEQCHVAWLQHDLAACLGDVTLTENTALYASMENRVSRKIRDLACAKAGLDGLLNAYTQLM